MLSTAPVLSSTMELGTLNPAPRPESIRSWKQSPAKSRRGRRQFLPMVQVIGKPENAGAGTDPPIEITSKGGGAKLMTSSPASGIVEDRETTRFPPAACTQEHVYSMPA